MVSAFLQVNLCNTYVTLEFINSKYEAVHSHLSFYFSSRKCRNCTIPLINRDWNGRLVNNLRPAFLSRSRNYTPRIRSNVARKKGKHRLWGAVFSTLVGDLIRGRCLKSRKICKNGFEKFRVGKTWEGIE